MKDFSGLQSAIIAAIRANGVGAITGPILQEQLLAMVDKMELSSFEGVATPETTPTTDALGEHFYIAVDEGDYSSFDDGLVVETGDIYLLYKLAGETSWNARNIASGLIAAVESLAEGKQDALTAGNGISMQSDTIAVKAGDGLTFDGEGNLDVDMTDDPEQDQTLPVSGKGVTDYIEFEKGVVDGIAPLDGNAEVPKENLPSDNLYYEPTTDPSSAEYVDEYQRVLAVLYQAIQDALTATGMANTATEVANNAANLAVTKATLAQNAAQSALNAAQSANTATTNATTATQNANSAAQSANTAASQAQSAINAATSAAQSATSAAQSATSATQSANTAAAYANDKGDYADTKGDYADEQGDYAKEQGDYAKDEIDGAKGDYESLDARFSHFEDISITLDPTTDPTDEEYQDEYQRILAVLYQALEDAQQVTANATTAAALADAKALLAQTQADYAQTKGDYANTKGQYAQTQGDYAKTQGDYAVAAINAAKGTYPSLDARLDDLALQSAVDTLSDTVESMQDKVYTLEPSTDPKTLIYD